ncbi:amylo-alpha-1,6-glucosidase [Kribbella italica]|uniref:Glycogen debranching enzyme n=1 Tax=Kribbella italica TaxID=1540520 RepID=A0A7W9J4S1_9ACTN|nr:glycogen debranching protein [Kribbella italica]MBB5834883.1 glycogen debranching enzyme [Kribbella italica]
MDFDLREIPFSRRGSWLALSPVVASGVVADDVHLVTHQTRQVGVFALRPSEASELVATPEVLRWEAAAGRIEAVFETVDTVRFRGRGTALELEADDEAHLFVDPTDLSPVFASHASGRRYRVTMLRGEATTGPGRSVRLDGAEGWEAVIEEFGTARPPYGEKQTTDGRPAEFDQVVAEVRAEFGAFVERVAGWRTAEYPAAEAAAYVLWASIVRADGFITREAALMSKHWMDRVWSWDHAFNALALAPGEPELALDQFLMPFDHQETSGALPDVVGHSGIVYNFVKPPIHGWAWRKLSGAADPEVYERLAAWTNFWLDRRRVPGHALPHYQHGFDSGWDNATIFDHEPVIESPDLATVLVLQLDALTALAEELGRADDAAYWSTTADEIVAALLSELYDGNGFVARGALSRTPSKTTSLVTALPIMLGRRLPAEVVEQLVVKIRRHLTDWGLASEDPGSEDYAADGYWRGPIWAPPSVLLDDGLRSVGQVELADEASSRFRRLCERSGFAENFDALTGEGLRDRAYTWTASAYLLLAREDAARRRHVVPAT